MTNIPIHAKAPAAAAVLGDSGLVQNYMRYSIGSRNPVELLRLAGRIRRFAPDLLVYLAVSHGAGTAHRDVHRDVLFFRLCGIRRLVGLPEGNLAENRFDPATGLWETEAARLLRCIRPLGDVDLTDPSNWDLRLTDAETAKAAELLAPFGSRPIISCGPGTKMQSKDWGQEKWRELLRRMSVRFPDHALTMIGAREDSPVAEYASASWNGPVLNFCGALTPRESAAVIRRARLFLGPDSGPMHLAAAYGVPCAIPFAALDLRGRWFPTGQGHQPIYHPVACSNCGLETCIEKKKICIDSISVEEMFQAAMQAIGRSERMP